MAVIILSFGVGYQFGGKTGSSLTSDLEVVEEAWNVIFDDYVDKTKFDAETLSHAAIEGMVESLDDPYTSFLEPRDYELGLTNLEGEFDGIGAHVTISDEQLTIIAPIAGSPAEQAGIRAGDIILEIDGTTATGLSLAEAVLKIRGPKGTMVRLLILHEDESEPEVIKVVRDTVELSSVRLEMMGDIAYINITQFSDRTDEELSPVLQSILEENASGIILDLRHNPGGLLETVVSVVSYFLQEGIVVNVVSNQEIVATREVRPVGLTIDLPMVVLVDGASASGSEVLAGALQDHGRATVAGTQTFGKGSVNILRQLTDGSGLYITWARWTTPNGRLIEGEGITPDYELELTGEEAIQWAIDYLKGNR